MYKIFWSHVFALGIILSITFFHADSNGLMNDVLFSLLTVEMGFFSRNDLPVLMDQKTTHREVEMCFEANASNCWEPLFD